MIFKDKITEIFCSIDDFCLVFSQYLKKDNFLYGKRQENVNLGCLLAR